MPRINEVHSSMVWYGAGVVWYAVWHALLWCGAGVCVARYGMARCGLLQYAVVWCSMAGYSAV